MILTGPVVLAAMVAIQIESPGHPIYRQRRVGRHGREFDAGVFAVDSTLATRNQ